MIVPKELQKYGLLSPTAPKRRRLIAVVYGKTGTGKSDLALRTMPRPLLVINIDRNLEPLEDRYVNDDVLIKTVRLPRRVDQEKDNDLYAEVRELYQVSTEKELFRSVSIDGADGLYDLIRRAKLGTLDFGDAPRSAFSIVNSNMKWWVSQAKDFRFNLLMTSRVKEKFVEKMGRNGKLQGVGTGEFERAGWKELEFEVPLVMRSYKDAKLEEGEDDQSMRYHMEVMKCTPRPEWEGEIMTGKDIAWANFGFQAYHPHTQKADWK